MKRINYLIGLGLLVAVTAPAVDLSKLPPAAARKDVTYATDIKPLFEASCIKCHGAERPKAGQRSAIYYKRHNSSLSQKASKR